MSKVYLEDSTLTSIANAIRAKTGGSSQITPANMPTEIGSISGGGGDLSISRICSSVTVCQSSSNAKDFIIPVSDYLPSDLNKLKALIILNYPTYGYSAIWYNNSSNLITATVTEYVDENNTLRTDAGQVPILINSYGVWLGYGTSYDRNPDQYANYALINGLLYTVEKSGNNYKYCESPNPTSDQIFNLDIFVIKEA